DSAARAPRAADRPRARRWAAPSSRPSVRQGLGSFLNTYDFWLGHRVDRTAGRAAYLSLAFFASSAALSALSSALSARSSAFWAASSACSAACSLAPALSGVCAGATASPPHAAT